MKLEHGSLRHPYLSWCGNSARDSLNGHEPLKSTYSGFLQFYFYSRKRNLRMTMRVKSMWRPALVVLMVFSCWLKGAEIGLQTAPASAVTGRLWDGTTGPLGGAYVFALSTDGKTVLGVSKTCTDIGPDLGRFDIARLPATGEILLVGFYPSTKFNMAAQKVQLNGRYQDIKAISTSMSIPGSMPSGRVIREAQGGVVPGPLALIALSGWIAGEINTATANKTAEDFADRIMDAANIKKPTTPPDGTFQKLVSEKQKVNLGGIDLSVEHVIDAIERNGAVFSGIEINADNGIMSFLAPQEQQPQPTLIPCRQILYEAVRLMHNHGSVANISFSLDPTSKKEWMEASQQTLERTKLLYGEPEHIFTDIPVPQSPRYIGAPIKGTAIGYIALHADMALKSLYFGYDYRMRQPLTFSSEYQRLVQAHHRFVLSNERVWFVLEKAQVNESDGCFWIDVRVQARVMGMEWCGGDLADTGTIQPESQALASYITEHFEDAKKIFPILRDLEETYRILVFLELLKRNGIILQDNPRTVEIEYPTPDMVQGMAIGMRGDDLSYRFCSLVGGVNFDIGQRFYFVNGGAPPAMQRVASLTLPKEACWHFLAADALRKSRLDEAAEAAQKAFGVNARDLFALSILGQVSLRRGDYPEALRRLSLTLEKARQESVIPGENKVVFIRAIEDGIVKAKVEMVVQAQRRHRIVFLIILSGTIIAVLLRFIFVRHRRHGSYV